MTPCSVVEKTHIRKKVIKKVTSIQTVINSYNVDFYSRDVKPFFEGVYSKNVSCGL